MGVVADHMKIAMVAPPWFEVPPEGYGGIEQMVATLVDGLEESGDEVTLIAAGEARTEAAEFEQTFRSTPEGLGGPDSLPIELIHAQRAAELLRDLDVDVVHDHSVVGPLLAPYRSVPTVATIHGPVVGWMRRLYASMRSVGLVAISNAQRAVAPELPWIGTVYNGSMSLPRRSEPRKATGSSSWAGSRRRRRPGGDRGREGRGGTAADRREGLR